MTFGNCSGFAVLSSWFTTDSTFSKLLNNWSELTARQHNVAFGNSVDQQFKNNEKQNNFVDISLCIMWNDEF